MKTKYLALTDAENTVTAVVINDKEVMDRIKAALAADLDADISVADFDIPDGAGRVGFIEVEITDRDDDGIYKYALQETWVY